MTATSVFVGVLAGNLGDCTVENIVLKDIMVSGNDYAGGLAGYASGGNITRCHVSGSTTGNKYVGGLLGMAHSSLVQIQECYAKGSVTGNLYTGGLIGQASGSVSSSCASGSVTSSSSYTGGLVGYATSLEVNNCYAACRINGYGKGLVYEYSSTTVNNSFYDSDLAEITSQQPQARTTEQMCSQKTYTDWDWQAVWRYKENDYPVLKNIEIISQPPFQLIFRDLTSSSVVIECPNIPDAEGYDVAYIDKMKSQTSPEISVENLAPDVTRHFIVDENSILFSTG